MRMRGIFLFRRSIRRTPITVCPFDGRKIYRPS
jgi:hypothetical protein